MYFVITPEGRYGPVSRDTLREWCREGRILPETLLETQDTRRQFPAREYLWQENGQPVALMVERLSALAPESWGQAETPMPPTTPIQTPVSSSVPMAHSETLEYRARVSLSPEEANVGTERVVRLTGYSPTALLAETVEKRVAIPPQIVTPSNPRVRYRNRNQGLPKPDGSGTDLVLLVEYDPNAGPPSLSPLPAAPKPAYPEVQEGVYPTADGMMSAPVRPATQPDVSPPTNPTIPVCPTEVQMTITRVFATTGGSLPVTLPSTRQRTVFLPPGVALRGTFKWVQMGEARPDGTNCDLRISFRVEG